jgi:spore germination protein YaaH
MEQAKTVDYLVIMGYDEHTSGSEKAGSNASLPFVKKGIEDTLAEVSKTQVINAIPFYTRAWTKKAGSDENPTNVALGMDDADLWVQQNGIKTEWDASAGQYKGTVQTNEGTLSIWLEEEKSIEEKMKLVNSYDLAGVAEWRLGFERNTVWGIINKYLNS